MAERKELWVTLDNFRSNLAEPWFVARDFNTVVSDEERIGCLSSKGSAQDFNQFFLGVGLMDTGYCGNKYTWSKREHV